MCAINACPRRMGSRCARVTGAVGYEVKLVGLANMDIIRRDMSRLRSFVPYIRGFCASAYHCCLPPAAHDESDALPARCVNRDEMSSGKELSCGWQSYPTSVSPRCYSFGVALLYLLLFLSVCPFVRVPGFNSFHIHIGSHMYLVGSHVVKAPQAIPLLGNRNCRLGTRGKRRRAVSSVPRGRPRPSFCCAVCMEFPVGNTWTTL